MTRRPSKPWLVQKYGGTSIGKLLPTITNSIIPSYLETHQVAIVCSARSGTLKANGTTSLLLEAIHRSTADNSQATELNNIIDQIKEDHLKASEIAVGSNSAELLCHVQLLVKKDCERLRSLLNATMMLGEISERTADRVLAFGELLSCRIVAASLEAQGMVSEVVMLDDIVEETYGSDTTSLAKEFRKHPSAFLRGLTDAIRTRIESCGSAVPVISGFFGAMPGSLIKSVSRGYSDLCAALCAAAVGAEELQIWKEVDGIFTADPRKLESARLLATITSEEAAELTYFGSEVIHPLTIEQIDTAGMLLRLKNVTNPRGCGTIIHPSQKLQLGPTEDDPTATQSEISFMAANGYFGASRSRRKPTAITTKDNITILTIRSHGTSSPPTFLSRATQLLEQHHITVDLISSSQQMLSLAICSPTDPTLSNLTTALAELGDITILSTMSIVSVIGHKMRNMVGIGAEIFTALAGAKVNIYLISQGASEINISFVVEKQDAQRAMEVVHEHVLGVPRHGERENAFAKGPWLY